MERVNVRVKIRAAIIFRVFYPSSRVKGAPPSFSGPIWIRTSKATDNAIWEATGEAELHLHDKMDHEAKK